MGVKIMKKYKILIIGVILFTITVMFGVSFRNNNKNGNNNYSEDIAVNDVNLTVTSNINNSVKFTFSYLFGGKVVNNSDTIKPSIYDDMVIEFTAMTAPDYRQQHIFTAMFYALMCTVNALISDSNIKYITAIDDKTANRIISHKHNPACNISGNIVRRFS